MIPRAQVTVMQNEAFLLQSHCAVIWVPSHSSSKSTVCSQGAPSCRARAFLEIFIQILRYNSVISGIPQPG